MSRIARMVVVAACVAAGLFAASGESHAIDCTPFPPPADFAVSIKSGFSDYVSITWTPDQTVFSGVNFSNYRVERRDVTAGGGFESIYTTTFRYSVGTTQLIADPTHVPSCISPQGCVEPGHTYTYRIFVQFTYAVGCPQNDGNLHDSAPSTEATLVVPGGAAGGGAATNVRAVADTKTPRVTVSWDLPAGKYDKVEVRRRALPKSSLQKADPQFTTFKTLAGAAAAKTKSIVDKAVEAEEEYEYAVAIHAVGEAADKIPVSSTDRAFTAGVCPKSSFQLWEMPLVVYGSVPAFLRLKQTEGNGAVEGVLAGEYHPGCEVVECDDLNAPIQVGRFFGRGVGKFTTKFSLFRPIGAFKAFKAGSTGRITGEFERLENFQPTSWLDVNVSARLGGKEISSRFRVDPTFAPTTTVCGTIAAPPQFKTAAAKPGQKVGFVFQCVALGPHPLLAERLEAVVTIEGGAISVDDITLGYEKPRLKSVSADGKTATFQVPALGPTGGGRSERATIEIPTIVAATPAKDGQLRCRVRFQPAPNQGPIWKETVNTPIVERYAEVKVDVPKPKK